jgi:hypothetical protein
VAGDRKVKKALVILGAVMLAASAMAQGMVDARIKDKNANAGTPGGWAKVTNGVLSVGLSDGTDEAVIDSGGALQTTSPDHFAQHEGRHYISGTFFTNVADKGTACIQIAAGANQAIHVQWEASADGKGTLSFFTNGTGGAVKQVVQSYNTKQNTTNQTEATVTAYWIGYTNGQPYGGFPMVMPGGQGNFAQGGAVGASSPDIFVEPNNDFWMCYSNRSGSATVLSMGFLFYESAP